MQPDEFKRLRKGMGWTQQQIAEELGMSRKAIVEMEAGKAPIEKRTGLAARHIFNSHSRLTSGHKVIELSEDVPLASAQIIWDRDDGLVPAVKVISIPGDDDTLYTSSAGACNADWQAADDVGRLLRLFSLFVDMTVGDKIPAKDVHRAFSVIPEYRWAMYVGHFRTGVEP